MPARPPTSTTLSLPRTAHWTLHHALLARLEDDDTPSPTLLETFERVDDGALTFTASELECIRDVLADYHHADWWERERSTLEELLSRVTDALEAAHAEPTRRSR